ncbi:hypothetical protein V6N13_111175 [Hibiscus sabdariffa]
MREDQEYAMLAYGEEHLLGLLGKLYSHPVNVKHALLGEGIANGYGLLAFIWKESRAVKTQLPRLFQER